MGRKSDTEAPDTRILRGKIVDLPLPDILQFLQVGGKSGALFLSRETGESAVISFRGGQMTQAFCTDRYQSLGDRLVSSGLITAENLHDGLAYMTHFPGMRIGDALVDKGILARGDVEDTVRAQMADTVRHLITWADADFEFRIGLVAIGRGLPEFAVDLILDSGVEPRQILLEAALLKDHARRARGKSARPGEPAVETALEAEADTERVIHWFDDSSAGRPAETEDPEQLRIAHSYLTISEELFSAQERGEMGLLLLRYASDLYADGGLLLKIKDGYKVLGQFGSPFSWGEGARPLASPFFSFGTHPLIDEISAHGDTYVGAVALSPSGGLIAADPQAGGSMGALGVPLSVLGRVSLILFCRTAVSSSHDARGLVALARQVSVAIENLALRAIARKSLDTSPV